MVLKQFLFAVIANILLISNELKLRNIPFEREKKFEIEYKGILLPHYYQCDLMVYDKIVVEIKAQDNIIDSHYKQLINYLAASNTKLGLLVNFGEESLKFKRVVL